MVPHADSLDETQNYHLFAVIDPPAHGFVIPSRAFFFLPLLLGALPAMAPILADGLIKDHLHVVDLCVWIHVEAVSNELAGGCSKQLSIHRS